jgi:hypothetical protein
MSNGFDIMMERTEKDGNTHEVRNELVAELNLI